MSDDPPPPESYWNSPEDWAEFFTFKCPSCGIPYKISFGSHGHLKAEPRPVSIQSNWNPTTRSISFQGVIICTCMVKFDVGGQT